MFSVVIPLFNKASFVDKAITSVLLQTFSNFEIIIVNDGSTDCSLEQAKQYEDHRLKIINQSNAGVSVARNNGVKHAQFEYIAFLDADDWWDKNFLQVMSDLINCYPEAGIYGSSYYLIKNKINKPAEVGLPANFEAGYINYFEVYARSFWVPFNCSFVVVRKSAFEKAGGFNPNLRFGEDFDLWVRMALKYKVAYVNKLLAYSNQDVEPSQRALGSGKRWKKEEHVIFNLDYLQQAEKKDNTLQDLLNGLRVRSLIDFYLNSQYPEEVNALLSRVDFQNQPGLYRFIYLWPKTLVLCYLRIRRLGSTIKQAVLGSI